jgi:hypothetical protein
MTIEQRVEVLEKSNRRLRLALSGIVLAASLVVSTGFLKSVPPGPVVATSVKVVDAKGKTVVEIKPVGEGGGRVSIRNNSPSCGVHFESDERLVCRANLQTMMNAVQAFAVKNRLTHEQLLQRGVTMADLMEDLAATPLCPSGGTYSFERGRKFIGARCSLPAHGIFEPGDDG